MANSCSNCPKLRDFLRFQIAAKNSNQGRYIILQLNVRFWYTYAQRLPAFLTDFNCPASLGKYHFTGGKYESKKNSCSSYVPVFGDHCQRFCR